MSINCKRPAVCILYDVNTKTQKCRDVVAHSYVHIGNVQKTIMTIVMWQKSKIIFKIAECCVTFYSEDGHNSNGAAVL